MKCANCNNLNFIKLIKPCLKCNIIIECNICVLCKKCSESDMQCEICLKRMRKIGSKPKSGCKSCGNK